jgi:hypothetical protein
MDDSSIRPLPVPSEIEALARDRAAARAARDWSTADALRARIEEAGWKVVDRGTAFRLEPAHPADIDDGGRRRYGSSESVPSLLGQPADAFAAVVLIANRWPGDLSRALRGLREHAPPGTQVTVVVDDPSPEQEAAILGADPPTAEPIGGLPVEQLWTSAPLGWAAALNLGLRRSRADVAILLDTSLEPVGDFVSPLVDALRESSVAVVGGWGVASGDLRHFVDAPPGDVEAVGGDCQAFRRLDYAERGPLDEHFRFYRHLDIWWSLVLRDQGPGQRPRRAVRLEALPLERHVHREYPSLPDEERERRSKRNFYRIIDRFGPRRDLLLQPAPRSGTEPARGSTPV